MPRWSLMVLCEGLRLWHRLCAGLDTNVRWLFQLHTIIWWPTIRWAEMCVSAALENADLLRQRTNAQILTLKQVRVLLKLGCGSGGDQSCDSESVINSFLHFRRKVSCTGTKAWKRPQPVFSSHLMIKGAPSTWMKEYIFQFSHVHSGSEMIWNPLMILPSLGLLGSRKMCSN